MVIELIIDIDLVILLLAATAAAPESWLKAKEGVSAPAELPRHHLFQIEAKK